MFLRSYTKLPYTVNAFMCLYRECDVWNNFTAKWKPACMRFPQALSNQCSSNRIHTTRLHLNTSLLSWLFNSLCYTLAHTDSPAPICLSLCSPPSLSLIQSISLFALCTFLSPCHLFASSFPWWSVYAASSSALHNMTLILLQLSVLLLGWLFPFYPLH